MIGLYPLIKIMNGFVFLSDVVNLKSTPSIIDSKIFLLILNSNEIIFFLQEEFFLQVLGIFPLFESFFVPSLSLAISIALSLAIFNR